MISTLRQHSIQQQYKKQAEKHVHGVPEGISLGKRMRKDYKNAHERLSKDATTTIVTHRARVDMTEEAMALASALLSMVYNPVIAAGTTRSQDVQRATGTVENSTNPLFFLLPVLRSLQHRGLYHGTAVESINAVQKSVGHTQGPASLHDERPVSLYNPGGFSVSYGEVEATIEVGNLVGRVSAMVEQLGKATC